MDTCPTTVISTKGQVILPKAVREHQRWGVGTRLTIEETAGGVMLRALRVFARTELSDVTGRLAYAGPAKSIEEMDAAVLAEGRRSNAGD